MRRLIHIIAVVLFAFAINSCVKSTSHLVQNDLPQDKPISEKSEISLKRNFYNGTKERLLGNFDLAANYFQKCIKIDHNHAASLYELARIYDYKGKFNDALAYGKRASEVDDSNIWLKHYYAELLEKNQKYSLAIKTYKTLLENNPTDIDLYYRIINAQLQQGDLKGSLEMYNKIEEIAGFDPSVALQRERILVQLKNYNEAINEIKKLIQYNPDEPRYYGMLAEIYQMKGNEDEAYETYLQLLQMDPDNPYIHLALSDYYQKKGNSQESFEEQKKAFQNPQLDIDTKIQILLNYFSMSAPNNEKDLRNKGFELCKIIVQTHPNSAKSHAIYGDFLYREENKTKEACEEYKTALKYDKYNFILWNQILMIESELNNFRNMLEESNEAITLFPNQPAFYLFNGIACLQNNLTEQAIQSLNTGKGLVIDNDNLLSQFYSNLGDAYHQAAQDSASDASYEKALNINPDNPYVLNNYSYYLSLRNQQLEKAEKMARRANELQPNSPSYMDTYGWVLFKLKQYTQSAQWLQKAINNGGSENGVILEHYGDVLFELGDTEGAMKYWIRARESGRNSKTLDKKIKDKKTEE